MASSSDAPVMDSSTDIGLFSLPTKEEREDEGEDEIQGELDEFMRLEVEALMEHIVVKVKAVEEKINKSRLPVAVSEHVHVPVEVVLERGRALACDIHSAGTRTSGASLPVAVSHEVHAPVITTDTAPSSSGLQLALWNPATDPWLQVRQGKCFKELFAYLDHHRKIAGRLMLSQHFSKNSQVKETRQYHEWTTLSACGIDDVKHLACGRYCVKLVMPYAYMPGDGFAIAYTSPSVQKKNDAKNYASIEIITALFLLHPSAVRLNFKTALVPCDVHHMVNITKIWDKLTTLESDALKLACGSIKTLSPRTTDAFEHKATTFTQGRAKTLAMFEPGHSDDEVIAVLYDWSKSKHFKDNTVIVSKYNPKRIWSQLARFVESKGLRDVILRNTDKVTLLEATSLQFRVHPDGLPVAADPSDVGAGGGSGEGHRGP